MRNLLAASIALSCLSTSSVAYAQEPWRDYWMRPSMMNWGFGLWWFMPFVMLAFWIVVIIGMISVIRWFLKSEKGKETKPEESALEILKKRYARGEIGKEDFERMKKDIS